MQINCNSFHPQPQGTLLNAFQTITQLKRDLFRANKELDRVHTTNSSLTLENIRLRNQIRDTTDGAAPHSTHTTSESSDDKNWKSIIRQYQDQLKTITR